MWEPEVAKGALMIVFATQPVSLPSTLKRYSPEACLSDCCVVDVQPD
jgi:hypothetical protein